MTPAIKSKTLQFPSPNSPCFPTLPSTKYILCPYHASQAFILSLFSETRASGLPTIHLLPRPDPMPGISASCLANTLQSLNSLVSCSNYPTTLQVLGTLTICLHLIKFSNHADWIHFQCCFTRTGPSLLMNLHTLALLNFH